MLSLRNLLVTENLEQRYYQILWFVQSAVLSKLSDKDMSKSQNWTSELTFYFDRLLVKTDRLSILEMIQQYRNNKAEIDSNFQSTMGEFIAEIQTNNEFIPFRERDEGKKLASLAVAELKVAAYEMGRISECKAQYLLSILLHYRLLQQFGCENESFIERRNLIDEVAINLQSIIGLAFICSQPLLNFSKHSMVDPRGCRSLLACFDEISIAVVSIN